MPTATPIKILPSSATKSQAPTFRGLIDLIGRVEQFTSHAARLQLTRDVERLAANAEKVRDLQGTIRRIVDPSENIQSIQRALESAARVETAPQNSVQSTFDDLLANGELLESAEFQKQAGWTRQALSRAVLAGRIFYIEVEGIRAYPAFYLDLRYNRKDVESVTKLLGDISGGSKWLFFTALKGSLAIAGAVSAEARGAPEAKTRSKQLAGRAELEAVPGVPRTPLQALEDGDVELVKRSAKAYAER